MRLGYLRDAAKPGHGFDGVFADCGFSRQHQQAGSIDHRVGDVADFRFGRKRIVDHRVQQFGGDDDRLPIPPRHVDDTLLEYRNLVDLSFDGQIAPVDHDDVCGGGDLVKMIQATLVFHLGNDTRRRPSDDLPDRIDMGGAFDETDAYIIDAVVPCESDHRAVMVGHEIAAQGNFRNVDAFAALQGSSAVGSDMDIAALDPFDGERQCPIVGKQVDAGQQLLMQTIEVHRDLY